MTFYADERIGLFIDGANLHSTSRSLDFSALSLSLRPDKRDSLFVAILSLLVFKSLSKLWTAGKKLIKQHLFYISLNNQ